MLTNKVMEQVAPATHAATYSSSKVRKLKCMFTTQVSKKRKAWSDGLLKIFFSGGTYQCSLIDCSKIRETSLVGRQLEAVEVQKLKKNEEIELEFEGYLVTVLAGNEYDETKVGPPLKLPKFVPPSTYVPANKPSSVTSGPQRTVPTGMNNSNPSAPYKVSADELDDIWDRETPTKPTARDSVQGSQGNGSSQYPQQRDYSFRAGSSSGPGPGYGRDNAQQSQHPSQQRHPNNAAEHTNNQRSIDKYFTTKSSGTVGLGNQSAQNPAGNTYQPSDGTAYNNREVPNTGPVVSNGVLAANNMYGAAAPLQHSQHLQRTPVPAPAPAQIPQRSVPQATVQAAAQRRAIPAGDAENHMRGNSITQSTCAPHPYGGVGDNRAANAHRQTPATLHAASVVDAPVPAHNVATYQPTGYSTIIGSSVWDSD